MTETDKMLIAEIDAGKQKEREIAEIRERVVSMIAVAVLKERKRCADVALLVFNNAKNLDGDARYINGAKLAAERILFGIENPPVPGTEG